MQSSGNLFEMLAASWASHPQRPVIETADGRVWTWAEIDALSTRCASALRNAGLVSGDRVSVQVAKSAEAIILYLACLRGGFVYHPLNPDSTAEELAYLLADAEPAAIVSTPQAEPVFRALAASARCWLTLDQEGGGSLIATALAAPAEPSLMPTADDDLAALLYSSGTTGRPKGVMLTHRNLAVNATALVDIWGFTREDRLLHALPLFHVHGLFVALHCALASGAVIRLLPRFQAETVIDDLPRSTVFMGVPTYYSRLLAMPRLDAETCRGVRLFISGSAPLLPETFKAFRQRTGHAILERYGMTETGMITSNPLRGERRAGSVGMPLPGVFLRVVDQETAAELPPGAAGELQVRGDNISRGYWRAPEKTNAAFTVDGWFRTGDLGFADPEGRITLVGRAADLIISGGLNVYPREVELCLDALEGIGQSAVIGVPDPDFGEMVVAFVEPLSGLPLPEPAAVIAHARGRLAKYKTPKQVIAVEALPRNAMGKVQKTLLRQRYAGGLAAGDPLLVDGTHLPSAPSPGESAGGG